MNKISLLLAAILFASAGSFAQAYESSIQYDKKKQQGLAIEYSYSPEAVENAIVNKLSQMGFKGKEEKGILNKDKGFLLYKNIYITDISKDRMDYLVKVERKSRKESDEAILYLVIMKKEENVFSRMSSSDISNAKFFLNDLLPYVEAADLELQIEAQEKSLATAEKKLRSLQAEREELEQKLADNLKTQDETIKEIDSHKLSVETLKGKRKKD